MTPNFAHKIVHSSAMYYQNFIIIHESSKKLLKMKNSKSFFLHLVILKDVLLITYVHKHNVNISKEGCILNHGKEDIHLGFPLAIGDQYYVYESLPLSFKLCTIFLKWGILHTPTSKFVICNCLNVQYQMNFFH